MTDKEVDALLSHWAEWVARDKDSGLGFPAKTVLGRLADGDITSSSSFRSSTPPLNILPDAGCTELYALAKRVIESKRITTS